MGEIRKYSCSCGYEEEVMAGAGYNAINREIIKCIFPREYEKHANDETDLFLENTLGICDNCKKLKAVATLIVRRGDNEVARYYKKCGDCDSVVTLPATVEKVECPKCGKPMAYTTTGHWD